VSEVLNLLHHWMDARYLESHFFGRRRDTCLSYNLGMWSGLRMDYDTLDIYFDNSGRVARALTVQH
jgi:hypothetical protein